MNKIKRLDKALSRTQKDVYARICGAGRYKATGHDIRTCHILMQYGLVKPNPASDNSNEYVLKGKSLELTQTLPLKRNLLKAIEKTPAPKPMIPEPSHKPVVWPSPAVPPANYSNISREQHVAKWLSMPVEGDKKGIVPVKCLAWSQMEYIMANHSFKSTQEMADHLGKEKYQVMLFCQANDIEPAQPIRGKWYHKKKEAVQSPI
jgi:hypothetical protein